MFDDLIIDSKILVKALRSTKIEEIIVFIFEISINFHRKLLLSSHVISHIAKNNKLNFWSLHYSHSFVKINLKRLQLTYKKETIIEVSSVFLKTFYDKSIMRKKLPFNRVFIVLASHATKT